MGQAVNMATGELAPTPMVSVLLPVFNGGAYVEAAVQSILGQTFRDLECIIIDDGSTDQTQAVLQQFRNDHRVVLVSRENRGLVETLNEGIRMARGQWIARMDADDIALPHRLARQLEWIEGTDVGICGSWARLFGTRDKRVLQHPQSDQAIKMGLMFGTMFAHPTVLIKTTLARQLLYDPQWEKCEDYDLWARAAQLDCRMANVPEVLLLYRQHSGQTSSQAFFEQQELTQKIRRRCGGAIFSRMGLSPHWADEILKLRDPLWPRVDMNLIDQAFAELLRRSQGESRAVVLDHLARLYYRAAAQCPDTLQRWAKLNAEFGSTFLLGVRVRIWLLSMLRMRPSSGLFAKIKTMYFNLVRR